jgi:hypothetical protein
MSDININSGLKDSQQFRLALASARPYLFFTGATAIEVPTTPRVHIRAGSCATLP